MLRRALPCRYPRTLLARRYANAGLMARSARVVAVQQCRPSLTAAAVYTAKRFYNGGKWQHYTLFHSCH